MDIENHLTQKLDSFTLEPSKNHLIRNFLRDGRVRVKSRNLVIFSFLRCQKFIEFLNPVIMSRRFD